MGFLTHRIAASVAGRRYRNDVAGMRETPERVVLGVRPGETASGKPVVRIYLGTEPGQARAERVFFWSVEQVRDPTRVYEIYLMKDLAGFRRQFWLTGFTNYRFAIPGFAGGQGRAIYNDVDQIYLEDPALLFDTPMHGHGFLSVSDSDTSVMLIDCGRMVTVWTPDAARRRNRKALEASAREVAGLWGPLDPEWNARDEEYSAGRSRLLHFTTLHTQPWNPFPEEYVYRPNPVGDVWFALERSADAAGYHPFNAAQPSARYQTAIKMLDGGGGWSVPVSEVAALFAVGPDDLGRILSYGPAAFSVDGRAVEVLDPSAREQPIAANAFDTAIAVYWMDRLPDEDLPWSLQRLFSSTAHRVVVRVSATRSRTPEWWRRQVAMAAALYPGIRWVLIVDAGRVPGAAERRFDGGPGHEGPTGVWVIGSGKPGHASQAVGLAQALGWRYELQRVSPVFADYVSLLMGLPAMSGRGLGSIGSSTPGVVVASGWMASRIARWIARRSRGQARAVLLGRKGGAPRRSAEIVVSCEHYGLPEHPCRVQVVLPPHPMTPETLAAAALRRPDLVADAPRPRIVALVGGSSRSSVLDETTAGRLGKEARSAAEAAHGSLFVVTSRRTGQAATEALRQTVGSAAQVHAWRRDEADNPYSSYLAHADILLVSGESESMIAEAAATGKPLYIYPVPETAPGIWQRLSARVAEIAERPRLNKRGTPRPQQGLEYLCARLIERGLILPPRNMAALHRVLVDRGIARMFSGRLEVWQPTVFNATTDAAMRVRALLGYARPTAGHGEEEDRSDLAAGYSFNGD